MKGDYKMADFNNETVEFYMVWTKKGNKPRRVHRTLESAVQEAQRLSGIHPDQKFIVLKAMSKISAKEAA